MNEEEYRRADEKISEMYGGRGGWLLNVMTQAAMSKQPVDVTTYSGNRFLEVVIDSNFMYPFMYGGGAPAIQKALSNIRLKTKGGQTHSVSLNDIWLLMPMPQQGFSDDELAQVDMSQGDEIIPSSDETVREMIRKGYHCTDDNEVDYFLRRFLAS